MRSGPEQPETARDVTAAGEGQSEEARKSFLEGPDRARTRSLGSTEVPENFSPVAGGHRGDASEADGAGSDGR